MEKNILQKRKYLIPSFCIQINQNSLQVKSLQLHKIADNQKLFDRE